MRGLGFGMTHSGGVVDRCCDNASAAAKVRDEGAEGGGERGEAVKHGSFWFADADADMSEVSCASGQRKN